MLFNSIAFAIFMPIVFIVYWLIPHKFRWPLLLISSYYFYMSWNPKYIVLILFTTFISYAMALLIEKHKDERKKKKLFLSVAVVSSLLLLFFFKYFNFASETITQIANKFALGLHPVTLNILLPVGISFYTFQTIGYVVDVYRGTTKAERNFGIYATFISFFPQLVAGPIERTNNLLPQIKSEKTFSYDEVTYGLKLMAWGFFKKLAIADVLAEYVDRAYNNIGHLTGMDYAMAIFFFTIQIYCDFSGYSDIAIGCARMLGIKLMKNFASPYFSKSIKEFWSRWHISLSTWFKDYVYIPLGGNRCSKIRNYFNLLATFLVSGLWHGAGWTYVIWGGIHGFLQVIEKALHIKAPKSKNAKRIFDIFSVLIVFFICNIAWVFFRAENLPDAIHVIKAAFVTLSRGAAYFHTNIGITPVILVKIIFCIILLAVFDYFSLKTDVIAWISSKKLFVRWFFYIFIIILIIICIPVSNQTTFIYFQF